MKKNTLVIAMSIIIAGALIATGIIVSGVLSKTSLKDKVVKNTTNTKTESKKGGLEIGSAPVLGDKNAPVTIIAFEDFQCPYCNKFFETSEKQIINKYVKTGEAKIVFKALHFLDGPTKGESYLSAVAGECAKEQGKFWDMHDAIFQAENKEIVAGKRSEHSGNLNDAFFKKTAQEIGLDTNKFEECLSSGKYEKQIASYTQDAETAMPNGIATPTLFINGKEVQGVRPFSYYEQIINSALKNKDK